jgi:hypothetical protein
VAAMLRIRFVEDDSVVIGSLRIIGCTLWSGYDLFGDSLMAAAMRAAYDENRDHKRIKWSTKPWRRFRPQEARWLHLRSRAFIEAELSKAHFGPTLVVTHFPPTVEALPPSLLGKISATSVCSDLLPIIDRHQPDCWIWGHTHFHVDSARGRTRMISNPSGYPDEDLSFDPTMVVQIGE